MGRDEFHFFIILRPFLVEKQFFAENFPFITKWRQERARGWQKFTMEIKNNGSTQNDTLNTIEAWKESEWEQGVKRSESIIHQFELFCHYYHSISSTHKTYPVLCCDKKQFHHHPCILFEHSCCCCLKNVYSQDVADKCL
jgi:hypothetical protein